MRSLPDTQIAHDMQPCMSSTFEVDFDKKTQEGDCILFPQIIPGHILFLMSPDRCVVLCINILFAVFIQERDVSVLKAGLIDSY